MKKILFIFLGTVCLPVIVFASQGTALIKGTAADSKISGEVTLTEENGGVTLKANLTNVPPGKHGFHIHENSSCADMGKAAGGHFNPDKVEHGLLPTNGPTHAHAGDMGNIEAAQDGTASLKIFMHGLSLKDGKYAVKDRSIVLHEKEDDFGQPTGNAGGRIGCGVIEIKN